MIKQKNINEDTHFKPIKITLKSVLLNQNEIQPDINNLVFENNDFMIQSNQFTRLYILYSYTKQLNFPEINKIFILYCIKALELSDNRGRKVLKKLEKFYIKDYQSLLKNECANLKNTTFMLPYSHVQNNTSLSNNTQKNFIKQFLRFINNTNIELDEEKKLNCLSNILPKETNNSNDYKVIQCINLDKVLINVIAFENNNNSSSIEHLEKSGYVIINKSNDIFMKDEKSILSNDVNGIIAVFSCQKYKDTRLKKMRENVLTKNEYLGWKVIYIIGDPYLEKDYIITDNLLTIKCEDSYIHLMKKVVFAFDILLSIYNVKEGILRCGDDIIINEEKLKEFLNKSVKDDYMGVNNPKANPNRHTVFKKTDNFMVNYYKNHPEDFTNRLHKIPYTFEQLKQFNQAPTTLTNVGVLVYFSKKSCKVLIDEMKRVNWNVFYNDEVGGYPYTIEDVGCAFCLHKYNIDPTFYPMFTGRINKVENAIAKHDL